MVNLNFGDMRRLAYRRALDAGQEKINNQITQLKSWLEYQLGMIMMEFNMSDKNEFSPYDEEDEHYRDVLLRVGDYIHVSIERATGNEKQAKLVVDYGNIPMVGKLKQIFDMAWNNALKMAQLAGAT